MLAGVAAMYAFGVTFNMISLFALILTAGNKSAVYLSARNVPHLAVLPFSDASAYDILHADALVIESAALGADAAVETTEAAPVAKKAKAAPRAKKAGARPKGEKGERKPRDKRHRPAGKSVDELICSTGPSLFGAALASGSGYG